MMLVAIKEIYLCVAFVRDRGERERANEQINVRITDGEEEEEEEKEREEYFMLIR